MLEKLKGIIERYEEIEHQLTEVGEDYTAAIELSKETRGARNRRDQGSRL